MIRRSWAALVCVVLLAVGVGACTQKDTSTEIPKPSITVAPGQDRTMPYLTGPGADEHQNYGRLYMPSGEREARSVPLVVLIHGGSWAAQIGANSLTPVARRLQAAGLAVWNIEYRRLGIGGGWPTTFTDVAAAFDFIPQLASVSPALNVQKVFAVGHSAGGQLAAFAASRGVTAADAVGGRPVVVPNGVVSLAGSLDMRETHTGASYKVLGGKPDAVPDRYAQVNPIELINPAVPIVAINGRADRTVPPAVAERFVQVAKSKGARAMYLPVTGGHASPVVTGSPAWRITQQAIEGIISGEIWSRPPSGL